MSHIHKKIPLIYRRVLYSSLALSWISGSAFWLIRRFAMVEGDFGVEPHFLQYPILQIHGAGAFVMLLCLGAVFSNHIPKTWALGRGKKSGLWISITALLSLISAYSLYYLVQESWHEILGNGHALLGVVLPVLLVLHIKAARKSKLRRVTQQCQP